MIMSVLRRPKDTKTHTYIHTYIQLNSQDHCQTIKRHNEGQGFHGQAVYNNNGTDRKVTSNIGIIRS